MEHGRKLLGALELAGAALIAAGLALRGLHRRLRLPPHAAPAALTGRLVLVLGADQPLGCELALQLSNEGCRVACAGPSALPPPGLPAGSPYYCCDPSRPKSLAELAQRVATQMGQLDMVVWAAGDVESAGKTPLDHLASVVNNDLMMHFHVVSQFVPMLARKLGSHFVTVDPTGVSTGSFAATGAAITALANTLTHQMADSSGQVRITRAVRRPTRPGDEEDLRESAAAILRAVEAGDTSLMLPSATQRIKNTLKYLTGELRHLWNQTILRQWKLAA